jgi:hypothetical protein
MRPDRSGHHHVEKVGMIHRLLEGRSGLSVFEPCAYKNGNPDHPGECWKAYRKYAKPNQHIAVCWKESDTTTDWLWQTRLHLLSQRTFDVVDLDGYGGPERLLLAGAAELVANGGYLFCTFPLKGAAFRFPGPRKQAEAVYNGVPIPTEQLALVYKTGLLFNRKVELKGLDIYEKKVMRCAFQVTRFTSIRTRMADVKRVKQTIKLLSAA